MEKLGYAGAQYRALFTCYTLHSAPVLGMLTNDMSLIYLSYHWVWTVQAQPSTVIQFGVNVFIYLYQLPYNTCTVGV